MRTLQKRKNAVSGLDLQQELRAWRVYFTTGADYFHDLKVVGIPRYEPVPRAVAQKAWQRLGSTFLATWVPRPGRKIPWGVEQFGE